MKKIKNLFANTRMKGSIVFVVGVIISFISSRILALIFTDLIGFIVLVAIVVLSFIIKTIIEAKTVNKLNIINILNGDLINEDWVEVIRLGYPLSRPLYLAEAQKLRLEIGELVLKAAMHFKDTDYIQIDGKQIQIAKIKASTYIDAIGWSKFLLNKKDYDLAKISINQGLQFANKIDDLSDKLLVLSKGYRHIASFYIIIGNHEGAKKYIQKMDDLLEKKYENSADLKICEAFAGLYNVKAEAEIAYSKVATPEEKILHLIQAKNFQEASYNKIAILGDEERKSKTFEVYAKIEIEYGDEEHYIKALDYLETGMAMCKEQCRRARYKTMLLLLLDCYERLLMSCKSFGDGILDEIKKIEDIIYTADIEIKHKDTDIHERFRVLKKNVLQKAEACNE